MQNNDWQQFDSQRQPNFDLMNKLISQNFLALALLTHLYLHQPLLLKILDPPLNSTATVSGGPPGATVTWYRDTLALTIHHNMLCFIRYLLSDIVKDIWRAEILLQKECVC